MSSAVFHWIAPDKILSEIFSSFLNTVKSEIKAALDYKPLPIIGRTKLPNLYNISRSLLSAASGFLLPFSCKVVIKLSIKYYHFFILYAEMIGTK